MALLVCASSPRPARAQEAEAVVPATVLPQPDPLAPLPAAVARAAECQGLLQSGQPPSDACVRCPGVPYGAGRLVGFWADPPRLTLFTNFDAGLADPVVTDMRVLSLPDLAVVQDIAGVDLGGCQDAWDSAVERDACAAAPCLVYWEQLAALPSQGLIPANNLIASQWDGRGGALAVLGPPLQGWMVYARERGELQPGIPAELELLLVHSDNVRSVPIATLPVEPAGCMDDLMLDEEEDDPAVCQNPAYYSSIYVETVALSADGRALVIDASTLGGSTHMPDVRPALYVIDLPAW